MSRLEEAPPKGATTGPNGAPFPDAVRTTLSKAESTVGYALPLPNDPLANSDSLRTVWMQPVRNGAVGLDYSSGVQVLVNDSPPPDPATTFKKMVPEISPAASVGSVQDQPALVIPQDIQFPNCTPSQGSPCTLGNIGSVEFLLGASGVTIYGHYPSDDLLRVADTVHASSSSPSPS